MLSRWACVRGLMVATFIVAACAGGRAKSPSVYSAEEILRSMIATYGSASSYEDHGTSDQKFTSMAVPHATHADFGTAFSRGTGFRHEDRDEWGGSPTITWMERGKLLSYRRGGAIDHAPGLGGPRFYSAVPRILLSALGHGDGLSDLKNLRVEGGAEIIDGHSCWRVVGVRPWGEELSLWIDQQTHVLRRTVARQHYPVGIERGAFDVETTTSYQPILNVTIPAARLAGPDASTLSPPRTEPWLGVDLADNPTRVVRVLGAGPAALAAVLPGDEVISLDGIAITDGRALVGLVRQRSVGAIVVLVVKRAGAEQALRVELGDRWAYRRRQRDLIDKPAPPFIATAVNLGSPTSLASLAGHLVVLDFTPPTFVRCENCETPEGTFMNKLQEKYAARGLRVVSVSTETGSGLLKVAIDLGLNYPLIQDDGARISNSYFVDSPMTTFVIDKAGIVRFITGGRNGIEALVEHLLE